MAYPNAANGIKKLFIGEVLALIGAVALATAVILAQPISTDGEVTGVGAGVVGLSIAGVLVLGGTIVLLLAFIFRLVGLIRAAKDEDAFRTALYVVIFGLLMTLASGVFTVVFPESVFLGNLGRVIGSVAELLATFLIIGGIGMIGAKLNDMGLQEKAGKLLGIIMTVIILRLIANIALLLFRESLAAFLVLVIGIMVLILSIVQYLLYLSLLSHAKNTLASH